MRQEYDLELKWIAFPLHPETPEEGQSLEELFAGRNIDLAAAMERLQRVAQECGLPFGERHRTYNSRRAQELGKWVEAQGFGDAYHDAVFRAYFVHGLNISEMAVLGEIVRTLGLDDVAARQVLLEGTCKDAVDRDWSYSRAKAITAVPTLYIDGSPLVGAQPYEAMRKWVEAAGAKKLTA